MLGQKYNSEDIMQPGQSFTGEISHLNIWKKTLGSRIISAMYRGCDSIGGNWFDWTSLLHGEVVGQVTKETSAECTLPGL